MTAFFFGPAERQLFGYYHAPRGAAAAAAVICSSWGSEYQYAHRTLRVTAQRLAQRGFHVLRFDYFGTGDSSGDSTEANADKWREDIALAIVELQAMSGHRRIDLIGVRLGAMLAASVASARSDVGRVVLWDPVVDGEIWVRELNGSKALRQPLVGRDHIPVEFAQRLISPALLRQFRDIRPAHYDSAIADAVLLLQTREGEGDRLRDSLSHLNNLQHMVVEDASPWLEDPSIWSGLVPAKAVNAIVEWLERR